MAPDKRARDSSDICENLRIHPVWAQSRRVMCFVPLGSEPDVYPLIRFGLAAGKQLSLPRHDPRTDTYTAATIRDLDIDIERGPHGAGQPTRSCPGISLIQLDLIVVPGLAFSTGGDRLGRGQGYYDRILAGSTGTRCGVAFTEQIVDTLPHEAHDVRVDILVTPTGTLYPGTLRV